MALPETVDCSVSVSGTCSPTVRAAPVVGDNTLALFRRDLTAYRGGRARNGHRVARKHGGT